MQQLLHDSAAVLLYGAHAGSDPRRQERHANSWDACVDQLPHDFCIQLCHCGPGLCNAQSKGG